MRSPMCIPDPNATSRNRAGTIAALLAGPLLTLAAAAAAAVPEPAVVLGLGRYYTSPQGGLSGADVVPPAAIYRSGAALGRAAPTNQWYSSVMFGRWSYPIMAHPLSYRTSEAGFELGLPAKQLVMAEGAHRRELSYPHVAAVTVSPLGFRPRDSRLSGFSDWLAEISLAADDGRTLKATVLHGSPFSYFECSSGDVRFHLAERPEVLADPTAPGLDPRIASFTVAGRSYAIFAPRGARWDWSRPDDLVLRLPSDRRYFSVAGLPDASAATRADFLAVAYAFPTETRVAWRYDERAHVVRTTFRVSTVAKEGSNRTTFMGLYPHQWSSVVPAQQARYRYPSVRGEIRLIVANSFITERAYHGLLPLWAGLENAASRDALAGLLARDLADADRLVPMDGRGTYWYGKGLGALAQLLSVAEGEGQTAMRDQLLRLLQGRLESWFDGRHAGYFVEDARLGTFVGIPQEYHSILAMNDHHFHYGYWLQAAAHVALRDPAWAAQDRWGGMVGKLAADIANDDRGRSDVPFLRNFDPYEGHSWASGIAQLADGNNQESSSEAINAWSGLALWGAATGNRHLRDLGAYLYTTEVASAQQYWFDLDRQVLAPEFGKPFASMVFGGKYAYSTWWTEEPRQVLGINVLPITPASTYLGADPAYVRTLVGALPGETRAYHEQGLTDGTAPDIWQDVVACYLALADGEAGLALWDRQGSVEVGETRSHTLFWLSSLAEMGRPDFSVTADTALYAVFRDRNHARTYLAYNAGSAPLRVSFSTGKVLEVAPRSLARGR